jgi:hypothetical protein
VARTDENGRHLKALLDYLLDGRIDARQVYQALGMSSSSYYRRIKEDDYPNADELHKIAQRFDLSFTDLQVRLGFITAEDLEFYLVSAGLSIRKPERVDRQGGVVRGRKVSALEDGRRPRPHAARSR